MTIKTSMFLLCFCVISWSISAEPFRVGKVTVVEVSSEMTQKSIKLGYSDAIAFVFSDPLLLLQGLEIELKIPQAIIPYRNSMSYSLYTNISPKPHKSIIDYNADKVFMEILPSRVTFIMQLPVKSQHTLKSDSYVTLIKAPPIDAGSVVLLRLFPVMKGLSEAVENAQFQAEIKPIFTNEGMLTLNFDYPMEEKKPFVVRIDETSVVLDKPLILKPGMHHVSIVSDSYRNEVRVFNIEQGKNTSMDIVLRDIVPLVSISAPTNVLVFFDDIELGEDIESRTHIATTPGTHVVRFVVGDYEVKKIIDVENGKNYAVSVLIDVEIEESP